MTVFSALSLAGVLFLAALAAGITVGALLAPRVLERRQRVAVEAAGITVAQILLTHDDLKDRTCCRASGRCRDDPGWRCTVRRGC